MRLHGLDDVGEMVGDDLEHEPRHTNTAQAGPPPSHERRVLVQERRAQHVATGDRHLEQFLRQQRMELAGTSNRTS